MLRLGSFLLAYVVLASPAAEAAVVRYEYQGQDFACDDPTSLCDFEGPGWTGFVAFDLDRLPGGTLSGASVSLRIEADPDTGGVVRGYTIGSTDVFTGGDFSGFVTYGGFLGEFLDFTVGSGSYFWLFDRAGDVFAWSGSNDCGGSCDPVTGFNTGDAYPLDGSFSPGPGTWTTLPSAPIPLPATVWLLAAGLAGLSLARRQGRSAVTRSG